VTATLDRLHVPYFLGGSIASSLYGMVRTTQDADLVAKLGADNISDFIQALKHEFFMDEDMITDAIASRSSFNIIHRESMFKVDVFIPKESPFINKQFARAGKEMLSIDPEIHAVVASPEDTVLAKLDWFHKGGDVSDRQWRDILGLLKVQAGALDLEYLRATARDLAVSDLLERAISEA